jgi:hypothetical protein
MSMPFSNSLCLMEIKFFKFKLYKNDGKLKRMKKSKIWNFIELKFMNKALNVKRNFKNMEIMDRNINLNL